MTIRFGCQTYTWQMSYDRYADRLPDILGTIEQARFAGVEAEVCMLGSLYADPSLLDEQLQARDLQLSALTLALPWQYKEESEAEFREAEQLIKYLTHFPDALMILVPLPDKRDGLRQRQANCLNCAGKVAERAREAGIATAFHPNSAPGSIFRTAEDYKLLFDGLDEARLGYCPDSGHIVNGGMDAAGVLREAMPLIRHVHFKDIDERKIWQPMGAGIIDHPGLVALLQRGGYDGWIMVEEESKSAEREPNAATLANGQYVNRSLILAAKQ